MKVLLATMTIFAAVMPFTQSAITNTPWCYHESSCNDTVWITKPYGVCNGTRQSPINIETAMVKEDANLTTFTFNGFSNNSTMKEIKNTGRTVKVMLGEGLVSVFGGGLLTNYTGLQFHLHWGNGTNSPGSEHTVDNKRYPMEMHIVNIKTEFNGDTSLALADPEGAAALGFFIEEGEGTGQPEGWRILTKYLANITNSGDHVNITDHISLDDLVKGVDRTSFYRYLGSLTTPDCNEIVVWTVFKDPIRMSKDLIDLFISVYVNNSSNSPPMTGTYRNIVETNNRTVTTRVSPTPTPTLSAASIPMHPHSTLGLLCTLTLLTLLHWK